LLEKTETTSQSENSTSSKVSKASENVSGDWRATGKEDGVVWFKQMTFGRLL
jgi:hypothetical protein